MDGWYLGTAEDVADVNCSVTNAGIAMDKPFLDHDWEEARHLLDVNVCQHLNSKC